MVTNISMRLTELHMLILMLMVFENIWKQNRMGLRWNVGERFYVLRILNGSMTGHWIFRMKTSLLTVFMSVALRRDRVPGLKIRELLQGSLRKFLIFRSLELTRFNVCLFMSLRIGSALPPITGGMGRPTALLQRSVMLKGTQ